MAFIEELEKESILQLDAIKEFRLNKNDSGGDYARRAKMAIGVIGSYVRLRATQANERSNDLISLRLTGPTKPPKALKGK